ncbi:MAG: hypothetical protein ACI9Y1_002195 [Lentisphaeria bacterium]|jgi:hypothetical protein
MEQETALFFSVCTGADVILWHHTLTLKIKPLILNGLNFNLRKNSWFLPLKSLAPLKLG